MIHSEVVEHVVINPNTSTDSHVNRVAGADLGQMPTAGDAFEGRKKPKRQQDTRVSRFTPGLAFNGLVARVELGKVRPQTYAQIERT